MIKKAILALTISVFAAGSAWATPTVHVVRQPGYYSGSGGEFTLTPNAELTSLTSETAPFPSFCLERTEYVAASGTYDVILNIEAFQGGPNYGPTGPLGGDALDARTAYLYSTFRAGTLTGYDYTPGLGRAASAGALQEVIWYLEDEMAMSWTPGDSSLEDTFYTAAQNAVDSGSWTGLGNVRVLNLYAQGHAGDLQYCQQDMLVTVPAPGAIVIGSLGTFLIGWLRRRRTL